jgi:RNA polymerase sigma-70 factor (ECF subfamily)
MQPDGPPPSWQDLLDRARAGSVEAVGEILEPLRPQMLAAAHDQLDDDLRPKTGPSDLVQESLVRACAHFDEFRGESPGELAAWLLQILHNCAANLRRDYRAAKRDLARECPLEDDRLSRATLQVPGESPSAQAIQQEEQQALHQALQRLPEDYRQVLLLRNRDGLSFEEIGRALNRSADATRMLYGRAVVALAQQLRPDDEHH